MGDNLEGLVVVVCVVAVWILIKIFGKGKKKRVGDQYYDERNDHDHSYQVDEDDGGGDDD